MNDEYSPSSEPTPEEEAQYAEMERLNQLSIKHQIPINFLQTHATLAGEISQPTFKRVVLDNYFQPTWRKYTSQILFEIICLQTLGLIEILRAYSLEDYEMIVYPFEYYENKLIQYSPRKQ